MSHNAREKNIKEKYLLFIHSLSLILFIEYTKFSSSKVNEISLHKANCQFICQSMSWGS